MRDLTKRLDRLERALAPGPRLFWIDENDEVPPDAGPNDIYLRWATNDTWTPTHAADREIPPYVPEGVSDKNRGCCSG